MHSKSPSNYKDKMRLLLPYHTYHVVMVLRQIKFAKFSHVEKKKYFLQDGEQILSSKIDKQMLGNLMIFRNILFYMHLCLFNHLRDCVKSLKDVAASQMEAIAI